MHNIISFVDNIILFAKKIYEIIINRLSWRVLVSKGKQHNKLGSLDYLGHLKSDR